MAETTDKETLQKFFNFSNEKCDETSRNRSLTTVLLKVAQECNSQLNMKPIPITAPPLLYTVATKLKGQDKHFPFIISYIINEKIKTDTKLNAAIQYLKSNVNVSGEEFEVSCGIGIEVSVEQVEAVVLELIDSNREIILEKRYRYNKGVRLLFYKLQNTIHYR